jgi:hypothetical protein
MEREVRGRDRAVRARVVLRGGCIVFSGNHDMRNKNVCLCFGSLFFLLVLFIRAVS